MSWAIACATRFTRSHTMCQIRLRARAGLLALPVVLWSLAPAAHAGLVSQWKLDDGPPATIASDSADSNPAAFASGGNSPTWSSSATLGPYALALSGNQWASAPDSASLDVSTGITLSAWVKRGRTGTREIFLGKGLGGGPGTTTAYWLEITASNTTDFYLGEPGIPVGKDHHANGATTITDTTTWHHLLGTYDGAQQKLYLDGVLQTTAPVWSGTILNSTSSFSIGRLGDMAGLAFSGLIDDVGLWNDALSEGEAKAVYNVAIDPQLRFDLGVADQLFQIHDTGSGLLARAGVTWQYATGLGAYPLGVPTHDSVGNIFLRLDAAGTGVAGLVPEPASIALLGFGFLLGVPALLRRRFRRRRAIT